MEFKFPHVLIYWINLKGRKIVNEKNYQYKFPLWIGLHFFESASLIFLCNIVGS